MRICGRCRKQNGPVVTTIRNDHTCPRREMCVPCYHARQERIAGLKKNTAEVVARGGDRPVEVWPMIEIWKSEES